ncbi:MAG TPA: thermonuclease family protein [Thermotogota bacterium]|nr:thermonuclease family protein [Thermotogota bacterium]
MKKTIISCICFCVFLLSFAFGLTRNGVAYVYSYTYLIPMDLSYRVITPAPARVVSVVDGNTVKVSLASGTESVRLIGVATQETVHPTKTVEAFGKEASDFLKKLCKDGQEVYLSYDRNPRDVNNQLLAYLWWKGDDGKWVLANLAIIENGYGYACSDFSFREDYMVMFSDAQEKARENGYGLWGAAAVSTTMPTVQQASPASIPSTSKKYQYIGNKNTKVFHRLTCSSLPDESNRVYFYTREEAIAAGYRPCGNCKP